MKNILLLSGSLRAESVNTKLLKAFAAEIHPDVTVTWGSLEMPLFNEDIEAEAFPEEAQELKDAIAAADGIIVATPEYNRAVPGALKNAIDWTSRPYGQNSWSEKRVLVTSASPGGISGAVAHYQLVTILMHMGAIPQTGVEFMLGHAFEKFDDVGELVDEKTKEHIRGALQKFSVPLS